MEVKILGSYMLESRDTRHTCFLIDRVLGLDAGSLASALSVPEQAEVKTVLLTHQHYDHIQDLPTLGLSTLNEPGSIDVYSLPETLAAVHDHLLNGSVYPDLTEPLTADTPKYKFHPFEPEKVLPCAGLPGKTGHGASHGSRSGVHLEVERRGLRGLHRERGRRNSTIFPGPS